MLKIMPNQKIKLAKTCFHEIRAAKTEYLLENLSPGKRNLISVCRLIAGSFSMPTFDYLINDVPRIPTYSRHCLRCSV